MQGLGAAEDLPLDFNRIMTAECTLSPFKLAWVILWNPRKIPALINLGRQSAKAAARLAETIHRVLDD